MFDKKFWKDASERAIATFAQVVLSISAVFIPTAAITSGESLKAAASIVFDVLPLILLAGIGGAILSILKSIVARKFGDKDSASLVE